VFFFVALGLVLLRQAPLAAETLSPLRKNPYKATTSRSARTSAVHSIPLQQLDADARAKVASVLSKSTIFRRLPIGVTQCDPEMYLFLVQHPDVVANIWQVLGISRMAMQEIAADTFQMTDGAGTVGTVEFLYSSDNTHLIYCEGSYDGPLFNKPVRGRGLIILKTGYVREPDDRYYVTSRMDTFVHVEHIGVDLLARTFQPLVGRVADINFLQTVGFLGALSRTTEVNLGGVQRLAGKLSLVQPGVREQFAQVAQRVAQKTAVPPERDAAPEERVAERPSEVDPR